MATTEDLKSIFKAPELDTSSLSKLLASLNGSGEEKKSAPPTTGGGTSATANISNIPDVTPAEASSKAQKTRDVYTNTQMDEDLRRARRRNEDIASSFIDNEEEWNRMYPYWSWNLAKENPRGNLNGMNFRDTRYMSRPADALNNERHLKPTDIGHRTLHYGSTGTGAEGAGSERWEPIETQEMRQMRANEELDKRARQRDVDRQADVEDYALELRKMLDKSSIDINDYAARTGIDLERFMQQAVHMAEYSKSWDTYWAALKERFSQELGLDISERIFAKLANIKDYPLKQLYALYLKGINAPTPMMSDLYSFMQSSINEAKAKGASKDEIVGMWTMLSLMTAMGNASAGVGAFTNWLGFGK